MENFLKSQATMVFSRRILSRWLCNWFWAVVCVVPSRKNWRVKNCGRYKLYKIIFCCLHPLRHQDSPLDICVNIFLTVTSFPEDNARCMKEQYSTNQTILKSFLPQNVCSVTVRKNWLLDCAGQTSNTEKLYHLSFHRGCFAYVIFMKATPS